MNNDLEHQQSCHELHREIMDTLTTVVHPNDLILQLLIAVLPLETRQRLLDLLSMPAQDDASPLKDSLKYQKALEIVSNMCKRSTYP